jgi:hypothetical protein
MGISNYHPFQKISIHHLQIWKKNVRIDEKNNTNLVGSGPTASQTSYN